MESANNTNSSHDPWVTNSQLEPRLHFRAAPPPRSAIDRFLQGQLQKRSNTNGSIGNGVENSGDDGLCPNLGCDSFYNYHQDDESFSLSALLPSTVFSGGNPAVYSGSDHSYELGSSHGQREGQQLCNNIGSNDGYAMMNSVEQYKSLNCSRNSRVGRPRKPRAAAASNVVKGQWSEDEDRTLIELVKQHGDLSWSRIAQSMEDRSGKQCRERWYNHLRPNIKKDSWSKQEERLFVEAHQKYGNKWAYIAAKIRGRTENSIKNHWYATVRKLRTKRRTTSTPYSAATSILEDYIKNNSLHTRPTTPTPSIFSLPTVDSGSTDSSSDHYSPLPELTDHGFFNNAGQHEEIQFMQTLCGGSETSTDHTHYLTNNSLPTHHFPLHHTNMPDSISISTTTTTTTHEIHNNYPNFVSSDLSLTPFPTTDNFTDTLEHMVFGSSLHILPDPIENTNHHPISLIPVHNQNTIDFFAEEPPPVAAQHQPSSTATSYYHDDQTVAATTPFLLSDTCFAPLLNGLMSYQSPGYSAATHYMSYIDAYQTYNQYDMGAAATGHDYFMDSTLGSATM